MGSHGSERIQNRQMIMKNNLFIITVAYFISFLAIGQTIDTDSLLLEATRSLKSKTYAKAIEQGRLGVKISPEYYDFHMLLGRVFTKTKKIDSAQFYFKQVIKNAPIYKDAFTNAIKLSIEAEEYEDALHTVHQAIKFYPNKKEFFSSKLKILQLKAEEDRLTTYLEQLVQKYPSDGRFQQLLRDEKSKYSSERFGIDYSYSTFNRKGYGPWHLTGLQYVHERRPLTLVTRVNYADRRSQGISISSGHQFTLESYIKTGKKGISYLSTSYSPDLLFPELLVSASYFHYFDSGWETELGGRYIKTSTDLDIYTTTLGVGKYLGSTWLNVTSFLFFDNGENYLAVNGTFRYYFNTKYDYIGLLTGYGNSPDESVNIIRFSTLDAYRAGLAYNKLFSNHFIVGLQCIYNRQEYVINKWQNQFDVFVSLQYKL
jgi:YaiO family outer membrane protein